MGVKTIKNTNITIMGRWSDKSPPDIINIVV